MHYIIRGFKGLDVENSPHLYFIKGKIFWKETIEKKMLRMMFLTVLNHQNIVKWPR